MSHFGLQELRAKVASAQASQAEMLQRAQDICSQAEERAAGAERRADRAEDRASKAEAELKVRPLSLQLMNTTISSRCASKKAAGLGKATAILGLGGQMSASVGGKLKSAPYESSSQRSMWC